MVSISDRVIELIKRGYSSSEITSKLNISLQNLSDILLKLKCTGIEFYRDYNMDGSTNYQINNTYYNLNTPEQAIIHLEGNTLHALLISDLHLGTKEERLDLLYAAYNYCILKNINIIINCGDIINGMTKERHNIRSNFREQVEYFNEKYPMEESILNICVLGNHDVKSLEHAGLSFSTYIYNYRPDFAICGIENGKIILGSDCIHLYHPLNCNKSSTSVPLHRLVLVGHSHKYNIKDIPSKNSLLIYVPALCNYVPFTKDYIPSCLDMYLYLDKGVFDTLTLEEITFNKNRVLTLSKKELKVPKIN